jgi:hypothetical protein
MVVNVCHSVNFGTSSLVVDCFGVEMPNTCSFEPKLDDFLCEKLIYGLVYPSNQNDFI